MPKQRLQQISRLRRPEVSPKILYIHVALTVAVIGLCSPSPAQPAPDTGSVVATAVSPPGTFSQRAAGETLFTVLPTDAAFSSGALLVGLPGAELRSKNGAVSLTCRADFGGQSPLPILETAMIPHDGPGADLTFTLDRGRVDLANLKLTGSSTVRIRFRNNVWTVVLEKPGSRVAVETIGRWPPGTPLYKVDPPKDHAPAASVVLLVLAGTAQVSDGKVTLALMAPPGPAMVTWTSIDPTPLTAMKLETVPTWANGEAIRDPDAKKAAAAIEKFRAARVENATLSLDKFVNSDDLAERRVGLIAAGAFDDLDRVIRYLVSAPETETCDTAVSVLRHWLGRGAGQDLAFYQFLRDRRFSPADAETIIYLLHGLTPEDHDRPETYEVLIEYLLCDQSAVRNLAAWHLIRLAPAGKSIPWKPDASPDEARGMYTAWKKLVPPGRLPAAVPGTDAPTPERSP